MEQEVEVWETIPGFPDYEASSLGRIRSIDRIDRAGRRKKSRILKTMTSRHGYLKVNLYIDGKMMQRAVHQCVALAFMPDKKDSGLDVAHNNGIQTDNRAVNLRWATRSENNFDKVKHGTHHEANKTECLHGHKLAPPNLLPKAFESGKRQCLSCNRTHAKYRSAKRGGRELDRQNFKEYADLYYSKLEMEK